MLSLKITLVFLCSKFCVEFEVFKKVALGGMSSEFHDGLGWHSFEEFERAECAATGV